MRRTGKKSGAIKKEAFKTPLFLQFFVMVAEAEAVDLFRRVHDHECRRIFFADDIPQLRIQILSHGAHDYFFLFARVCALAFDIGNADFEFGEYALFDGSGVVADDIQEFRPVAAVGDQVGQQAVNDNSHAGVKRYVDIFEHRGGYGRYQKVHHQIYGPHAEVAVFRVQYFHYDVESARRAVAAEHKAQPDGGKDPAEYRGEKEVGGRFFYSEQAEDIGNQVDRKGLHDRCVNGGKQKFLAELDQPQNKQGHVHDEYEHTRGNGDESAQNDRNARNAAGRQFVWVEKQRNTRGKRKASESDDNVTPDDLDNFFLVFHMYFPLTAIISPF